MSAASLTGLNALVTGGGSGIGLATARTLSAAGARVVVLGRTLSKLERAVAAGAAASCLTADATDEAALAGALAGPAFDIVVNNAGGALSAPFLRTPGEDFRRMLDLNLMSAVYVTRFTLPGMIARGFGRIVNVGSTASLQGFAYVSAYAAAKHALLGFTRSLALETARKGVLVNAVCPGFVDTDLVAASVAEIVAKTGRTTEDARAELAKANPQGRLIAPEDVAAAILPLVQRECSLSGAAVEITG